MLRPEHANFQDRSKMEGRALRAPLQRQQCSSSSQVEKKSYRSRTNRAARANRFQTHEVPQKPIRARTKKPPSSDLKFAMTDEIYFSINMDKVYHAYCRKVFKHLNCELFKYVVILILVKIMRRSMKNLANICNQITTKQNGTHVQNLY